MSVCVQAEEDSASEEPPGAPVRELYEQKAASKVVRVLTVLAYLLSVSLAAILLSVYYVCVWKSPALQTANHTEGQLSALHGDRDYYLTTNEWSRDHGGGSTTVNDVGSPSAPDNTSDLLDTREPPDSTLLSELLTTPPVPSTRDFSNGTRANSANDTIT